MSAKPVSRMIGALALGGMSGVGSSALLCTSAITECASTTTRTPGGTITRSDVITARTLISEKPGGKAACVRSILVSDMIASTSRRRGSAQRPTRRLLLISARMRPFGTS